MSNYPAGVNDDDEAFNLPSVGDGEGCCSNPDCESWRDGYDGEPCYSCQVSEASECGPHAAEDEMTHCANNEYGCDSPVSAELGGKMCGECAAAEDADRAYWLRVFTYDRPPTEDGLEAYTEPCERGKRAGLRRMIGGVGDD